MNDTPEQPNPNVDDVTGYRRLNQQEIDLLNQGKRLANQVGAFIENLDAMATEGRDFHTQNTIDKRWLAIARTDLQKGFMSMIRAIAKPTSF